MNSLLALFILLLATFSFAQGELRISDQSKFDDYKRIDIHSLNQMNQSAETMNNQERKESFKFFLISTPFRSKIGTAYQPVISGSFHPELLKSIAELMIEEMENVDRLAVFNWMTVMSQTHVRIVRDVWDCFWIQTMMGEYFGSAYYVQKCSEELISNTYINEKKAQSLITSMLIIFKATHLFSRMQDDQTSQLGEAKADIFNKLSEVSNQFYKKHVRVQSYSNYKAYFSENIVKMGARDPEKQAQYEEYVKLMAEDAELQRRLVKKFGIPVDSLSGGNK